VSLEAGKRPPKARQSNLEAPFSKDFGCKILKIGTARFVAMKSATCAEVP
jgi:hypothetical protein